MNNGIVLFLGILLSLAASFWTLLFAPQLQVGRQDTRTIDSSSPAYPTARPGLAQRGADIFRAQGCAECHTRQVRQTGAEFDVYLTDAGTNPPALAAQLAKQDPRYTLDEATRRLANVPARLATGMTLSASQKYAYALSNGNAIATPVLVPLGPDLARGWGKRLSVAQDYLQDYPVQLGSLRLGPDLANYGARQTNATLVLSHLYNPSRTVPGSMMPPYRFLFEVSPLRAGDAKPANAIPGLGNDKEAIVPTDDAVALAAYLTSLKAEADLFEAPVPNIPAASAPAPATNAAAAAPAP